MHDNHKEEKKNRVVQEMKKLERNIKKCAEKSLFFVAAETRKRRRFKAGKLSKHIYVSLNRMRCLKRRDVMFRSKSQSDNKTTMAIINDMQL